MSCKGLWLLEQQKNTADMTSMSSMVDTGMLVLVLSLYTLSLVRSSWVQSSAQTLISRNHDGTKGRSLGEPSISSPSLTPEISCYPRNSWSRRDKSFRITGLGPEGRSLTPEAVNSAFRCLMLVPEPTVVLLFFPWFEGKESCPQDSQKMRCGGQSTSMTPPFTRTRGRRWSWLVGCLRRFPWIWPSRDAWWPSISEHLITHLLMKPRIRPVPFALTVMRIFRFTFMVLLGMFIKANTNVSDNFKVHLKIVQVNQLSDSKAGSLFMFITGALLWCNYLCHFLSIASPIYVTSCPSPPPPPQVNSSSCVLAMDQSVFQRDSQLHQQERRCPYYRQVGGATAA